MFGMLDTSTSALVAQRIRIDTIAGNIANAHTHGYQRRVPIFAVGQSADRPHDPGVHVSEIQIDTRPGTMRWDPTHPLAIRQGPRRGYVEMPNVSVMNEMINAIEAARAYDANITMINATKAMADAALRVIA